MPCDRTQCTTSVGFTMGSEIINSSILNTTSIVFNPSYELSFKKSFFLGFISLQQINISLHSNSSMDASAQYIHLTLIRKAHFCDIWCPVWLFHLCHDDGWTNWWIEISPVCLSVVVQSLTYHSVKQRKCWIHYGILSAVFTQTVPEE